jgi:predicted regulator of amino acid metabolism with ACT domain
MTSIRHQVERTIESDPVIKKGLQRRIINSRALARYILESGTVDSTPDAVLGIIRRYPVGRETGASHRQLFEDCEIAMRNRMADLAIENGADVMRRIADFAATIKTTRGENLRIIVGVQSIRVIAYQKTLDSFVQTLRPREIINYSTNLAEISLLFPYEATKVKGMVAKVTAQLALNDVNLVGIFCCSPEDIIMVTEQDAPRALEALQKLLTEEAGTRKFVVEASRGGPHKEVNTIVGNH